MTAVWPAPCAEWAQAGCQQAPATTLARRTTMVLLTERSYRSSLRWIFEASLPQVRGSLPSLHSFPVERSLRLGTSPWFT